MDEMQQARTVAVKACKACNSALLERDKYCRWCGARQPLMAAFSGAPTTSLLAPLSHPGVYRSVSGPLVNAVVSGALTGASTENQSRFLKRVTLALISIPIWLIIVLLSPLDAYSAVKNLAR